MKKRGRKSFRFSDFDSKGCFLFLIARVAKKEYRKKKHKTFFFETDQKIRSKNIKGNTRKMRRSSAIVRLLCRSAGSTCQAENAGAALAGRALQIQAMSPTTSIAIAPKTSSSSSFFLRGFAAEAGAPDADQEVFYPQQTAFVGHQAPRFSAPGEFWARRKFNNSIKPREKKTSTSSSVFSHSCSCLFALPLSSLFRAQGRTRKCTTDHARVRIGEPLVRGNFL